MNMNPLYHMKKFLVFLSLFAVSFSCFSQTQPSIGKFSVQLKAGTAIPLGRFAHKSFSFAPGDTSGNALAGFSADVLVKYQLTKTVGISLMIGESINKQDAAYLRNEVKKNYSDRTKINVKVNSWKVFKVMTGVYYSIPFSSGSPFELTPMVLVGICKTKIPGYSYEYRSPTLGEPSGSLYKVKLDLPAAFCYNVSMALNYKLSKRFFLSADANYFGASPVMKYTYFANWPDVSTLTPAKKHYSLSSLNFQIGAGIRF